MTGDEISSGDGIQFLYNLLGVAYVDENRVPADRDVFGWAIRCSFDDLAHSLLGPWEATFLYTAMTGGDIDAIILLTKAGLHPGTLNPGTGYSALHMTALYQQDHALLMMLSRISNLAVVGLSLEHSLFPETPFSLALHNSCSFVRFRRALLWARAFDERFTVREIHPGPLGAAGWTSATLLELLFIRVSPFSANLDMNFTCRRCGSSSGVKRELWWEHELEKVKNGTFSGPVFHLPAVEDLENAGLDSDDGIKLWADEVEENGIKPPADVTQNSIEEDSAIVGCWACYGRNFTDESEQMDDTQSFTESDDDEFSPFAIHT